MRVLVCGGRDYTSCATLFAILDQVHRLKPVTCIIAGEAHGADTLARHWAQSRGVAFEGYPADWQKHGKSAGYIRNKQMLTEGCPDKVIAFPGGRGTADMVRQARKAGLRCLDVPKEGR